MSEICDQEKLLELVRNKLQCNICLSDAGVDAVETMCPGRHTFCFECMVKYVYHFFRTQRSADVQTLKCPSCRSGSCNVTPSMFISQLCLVQNGDGNTDSDNTGWVKHFHQIRARLKTNYPSTFSTPADEVVITPSQMVVYNKYRNNPLGFILHRHRFNEEPGRQSSRHRYIGVNINEETMDFVVSSHRSRTSALNMVVRSPSQFTLSFVCGHSSLASERELARGWEMDIMVVFFQSKPVQLFLSTPQNILIYLNDVLNNPVLRQRLLDQISYVSAGEVNEDDRVGDRNTMNEGMPAWLPT